MEQDDEMSSDYCAIIFGNSPYFLLEMMFPKREKNYTFPIDIPFNSVLETLRDEWEQVPFDVLYIQAPTTIESLLLEFYKYNNLPFPMDQVIRKKIQYGGKFFRFLKRRVSPLFPECKFFVYTPSLEMFIRDSSTGEFRPPIGQVLLESLFNVLAPLTPLAPLDPAAEEQLEKKFTLENFRVFLESGEGDKDAESETIYHHIFENSDKDCFYAIKEICDHDPEDPNITYSIYYLVSITLFDYIGCGGMFSAYIQVELAEELVTELKKFPFEFHP